MSSLDKLATTWGEVSKPPVGRLNGRRVPDLAASTAVWLAVDYDEAWHLLIELPPGSKPVHLRPTKGLEVRTDEMRVGDEPSAVYIDLICLTPAFRRTFLHVVDDILSSIEESPDSVGETAMRVLLYWRRFWSVSSEALSQEAALGLFGELWFLENWVGLPNGVKRWVGPSGAIHDFRWDDFSVEVKTARYSSQGPVSHRIASLDQLVGPSEGVLYLFSLQVIPDLGAVNTLPGIVGRIRTTLEAEPELLSQFLDRIAESGYSPALADAYSQPWRIMAENLYHVHEGFPRLTQGSFLGGVPDGVVGVSYSILLDACSPWRLASSPSGASFLRT